MASQLDLGMVLCHEMDGKAQELRPIIVAVGRDDWQARYRIFVTVESGSRAASSISDTRQET